MRYSSSCSCQRRHRTPLSLCQRLPLASHLSGGGQTAPVSARGADSQLATASGGRRQDLALGPAA
eukprot:731688-Rhodomonas_salina.1